VRREADSRSARVARLALFWLTINECVFHQPRAQAVHEVIGIAESDTGLGAPATWDLVSDKQMMQEEHPLQVRRRRLSCSAYSFSFARSPPLHSLRAARTQVARCTKIINAGADDAKYVINLKQLAKFVVALGDKVAPTDIEEGMCVAARRRRAAARALARLGACSCLPAVTALRLCALAPICPSRRRVGVERQKYTIQIPLPPRIDPSVTMMTVEEKPDVTYDDVGGAGESLEKLREVVELPLLHPERFVTLGIDPPKGVLLYGPPGTGKTLSARAVANRTDACFIRVIGSELIQKYVGEGARMVRELFQLARSKKACIIFFDEIDAIGGSRFDDSSGGDGEVQRTMLEIVNQLDGFDARGNVKVLMATNRPDTLDPALLRPGRLDRKVEFGLPDLHGRVHILRIHAKSMAVDKGIRYELLARLCPSTTGAELRAVCSEAGMFAIRARRRSISEKDFLDAINKVVKQQRKFSALPKYAALSV
jgi:26S proteasome regulatory subunit T1